MAELTSALRENTKAVRENTALLRKLTASEDKEMQRADRRKLLLQNAPYSEDELLKWKRQDLVMYAAQLGVRNTSVGQDKLVAAVLKAQND